MQAGLRPVPDTRHNQETALADRANKNDPQAHLRKMERAADGKKAMAEYEAEADAMRAKTEKLRALRLAHEAANPPALKAKGAAKKASAKKTKTKATPLSDWLQDRESGGRNN
jgi:hypothetical protein